MTEAKIEISKNIRRPIREVLGDLGQGKGLRICRRVTLKEAVINTGDKAFVWHLLDDNEKPVVGVLANHSDNKKGDVFLGICFFKEDECCSTYIPNETEGCIDIGGLEVRVRHGMLSENDVNKICQQSI